MKSLGFAAEAYASGQSLRIGSTAHIMLLGRRGTSALMVVGIAKHQPANSMAGMGAPGCYLLVRPGLVAQAGSYRDFPHPGLPAYLDVLPHIPLSNSIMGSRVFLQFANNETMLPKSEWTNAAGMTTTNGLDLTISALPPRLGMATIRSDVAGSGSNPPPWGVVDVSQAPVIRFTYK
jgi:hypothetical protein